MEEARVVVLANSLERGKSRLQEALGPPGRGALVMALLRRSFAVAIEFAGTANCTVVSHCTVVLDLAEELGVGTLKHSGEGGLNGAARFALQEVRQRGATHVLLMATDMPRLRVADLRAVAETGAARRCVVIGADRHGTGTNLLFVPAGAAMRPSYGPGSLQRHLDEGRRAAGDAVVYCSEEVGFDIDTPEDLREWRSCWGPVSPDTPPEGRARAALSAV